MMILSVQPLLSQTNSVEGGIVPRFNVTDVAFRAVGNGTKDDTAAIQAAFDRCWNHGEEPYGGVVELPGRRTYVISKTINAYDSCRIEGATSAAFPQGPQMPTQIQWNGTRSGIGTVYKLTSFTAERNVSSITLNGNPNIGDSVTINGTAVKFVASAAGPNQVEIESTASATATALGRMLNASPDRNLKQGHPYTNPGPGVIATAYQMNANGPNYANYVETLISSDPTKIQVNTVVYAPSSPPNGRSPAQPYRFTFPVANTLNAGDWVILQGCTSSQGLELNNVVGQVGAASPSSFTIVVPFQPPNLGTYTDPSCTATTTNVAFAFDSLARYGQEIKDLMMTNLSPANPVGVHIYFGSRVDTGTRLYNTWIDGARWFNYYFSAGGINVEFDKGWRSDGSGYSAIYWRVTASDDFAIANGEINNAPIGGSNGAEIMLDNQACSGDHVNMHAHNMVFEADSSMNPGMGDIVMLDCPSSPEISQFNLDIESAGFGVPNSFYAPPMVMTPPNDRALSMTLINVRMSTGANTPQRFVGLPRLTRFDKTGAGGIYPMLVYSPPQYSSGFGTTGSIGAYTEFAQFISDVQIDNLFQKGVPASAFLFTDAAFGGLPNGTTLAAGQILAPPVSWSDANGRRYALYVVSQAGTTGIPNGGKTECSGARGGRVLTCNSDRDLSSGQRIAIGADTNKAILYIDATHPDAVLVQLTSALGSAHSRETLSFSAPILGPEIQIPTKTPGAPSGGTWSQGDLGQNLQASANGVAAWVNIAPGKPGAWAGIPLGNEKGQLSATQLSPTTGSGNIVLSNAPTVSGLTDTGTAHLNSVTISGTCVGCSGQSIRTAQAFFAGRAPSSSMLSMSRDGSTPAFGAPFAEMGNRAQFLMTTSGTLGALAVRCSRTGVDAESGVFSVWDLPSGSGLSGSNSGFNTGVTVTYGTTGANTTLFDSTHTFAYQKGDLLRIQFTTRANETLGDCEAAFNY